MKLKKGFQALGVTATLIGSLFMFQTAWASASEWISALTVPSGTITSLQAMNISWNTNTSGPYYEYRTAYYATTTYWNDPIPTTWKEFPMGVCRHAGIINGTVIDNCAVNAPKEDTTSTLWIRATTNFAVCGTYTPTPDTANCGSAQTTKRLFSRSYP